MRTIGALIFPKFELLDLFGPLQMFGMLKDRYKIDLVAQQIGPIVSNGHVSAYAEHSIYEAKDYDILLVPGGMGTRKEVENEALLKWIKGQGQSVEFILSVCTGSALLAKAGLLDDKSATTNKSAFHWVTEQGPHVHWKKVARWVQDGNIFTSSGVSAGIDMSLAAIEHMHGKELAQTFANYAEYHWQDDPNRDPFAKIHGLVDE